MKKKICIVFSVMLIMMIFLSSNAVNAATVYKKHTVSRGETIFTIARATGLASNTIITVNGLDNGNAIYPGQVLLLDSNGKSSSKGNYTVKKGDTLAKIANKNGITLKQIKEDNGLSANRIYPGQKLYVSTVSEKTNTTNGTGLSLSDGDIYKIAKMIYGEARGESYKGQVAVGAVIVNRIKSKTFPNTVSGVLFQKNQFTAYSDGQYFLTPNQSAVKAANEAVSGVDPSLGALFYWNPAKAYSSYLNKKTVTARIGNHVFVK